MFKEALEISRFPEIIYTSTRISASRLSENLYATTIAGKLTLHGVTNELDFSAQVGIGQDSLRGYGNFPVKQSEYDIVIASVVGGTLKMRDEFKLLASLSRKSKGDQMTESTGAKMVATDVPIRYRIDVAMSRFTVRAFATGLFSSLGHHPTLAIRDYTGDTAFAPSNPGQSSIRISVKSESLTVAADVSQKDRNDIETKMRQDVLETSSYPEIVFESSQVLANKLGDDRYAANVTGNLTLHGITRQEKISAQVSVMGDVLRAHGECSLRQSDYGIKLVSVAAGTLKVKDEVKIAFDLTARKQ